MIQPVDIIQPLSTLPGQPNGVDMLKVMKTYVQGLGGSHSVGDLVTAAVKFSSYLDIKIGL